MIHWLHKRRETPALADVTFILVLALLASLFYLGVRQVMLEREFLAAQDRAATLLETLATENELLRDKLNSTAP